MTDNLRFATTGGIGADVDVNANSVDAKLAWLACFPVDAAVKGVHHDLDRLAMSVFAAPLSGFAGLVGITTVVRVGVAEVERDAGSGNAKLARAASAIGIAAVEEIEAYYVGRACAAYAEARFGAVIDYYLLSSQEYVELVLSMGERVGGMY